VVVRKTLQDAGFDHPVCAASVASRLFFAQPPLLCEEGNEDNNMTFKNRTLFMMALLFFPILLNAAADDDERGWSASQQFQGTSNAAGVVLKTSSTAVYSFNQHIDAYTGIPVYFARATSSSGKTQFVNGIGNVYSGLLVTAGDPAAIHYSSDLVFTVPTGDPKRGFSTGHPTIDWTNTFSHSFAAVTPYASIGAANTISDTSFFVRPFSSKGIVSHFEAGALIDVAPRLSIGASGYGLRATGQQQINSKVVDEPSPPQSGSSQQQPSQGGVLSNIGKSAGLGNGLSNTGRDRAPAVFQTQQETVGPAAVANDHGFSAWLTVRPTPLTDFHVGYSRSVAYQLNSLFFGVGFRFGHHVSVID
jgi:hypothetical protein